MARHRSNCLVVGVVGLLSFLALARTGVGGIGLAMFFVWLASMIAPLLLARCFIDRRAASARARRCCYSCGYARTAGSGEPGESGERCPECASPFVPSGGLGWSKGSGRRSVLGWATLYVVSSLSYSMMNGPLGDWHRLALLVPAASGFGVSLVAAFVIPRAYGILE